jgi:hypothetical protein
MNLVSPLIAHYLEKGYCRDYTDAPSKEYKLVVVPFADSGYYKLTTTSRLYFPADTQLDRSTIKAIDVVLNSELLNVVTADGSTKDVIGQSGYAQATITICDNNKNVIATLAPGSMCLPANNGKHTFTDFTDMVIGNSYIEFSDISGLSSTNCFVIKVYYNEI